MSDPQRCQLCDAILAEDQHGHCPECIAAMQQMRTELDAAAEEFMDGMGERV